MLAVGSVGISKASNPRLNTSVSSALTNLECQPGFASTLVKIDDLSSDTQSSCMTRGERHRSAVCRTFPSWVVVKAQYSLLFHTRSMHNAKCEFRQPPSPVGEFSCQVCHVQEPEKSWSVQMVNQDLNRFGINRPTGLTTARHARCVVLYGSSTYFGFETNIHHALQSVWQILNQDRFDSPIICLCVRVILSVPSR